MKRVQISSEGGTGVGTTVVDAETGAPIHGISAITIAINVEDPVKAVLDLVAVECFVEARPEFQMRDPSTGEFKTISEVRFSDGSKWTALQDVTALGDDHRQFRKR